MNRRRALLLALLGTLLPSATAGRPKRVAMLTGGVSPEAAARARRIMLEYLAADGLVAGRDVEVEVANLDMREPAFAKVADEIVASNPDAIAVAGTETARAFQARTTRIPIVFRSVGDPVAAGLVETLARPGRNVTGESNQSVELDGKRLELLLELRPRMRSLLLITLEGRAAELSRARLESETRRLGLQLEVLALGGNVGEERDFEHISSRLAQTRAEGLIFQAFQQEHPRAGEVLATLSARNIPTLFLDHRAVRMGGLVSLGVRIDPPEPAPYRMVARILRGENPATMPVVQSMPHMALNLRTAREMKLAIPQSMRIRADEVIG